MNDTLASVRRRLHDWILLMTNSSKPLTLALFFAPATLMGEETPYKKKDGSWISINGTVTTVGPDSFKLDYGKGIVLVEMDDWDMDADGFKLIPDDNVIVYGRVDDDLFEKTTIEANSVYVKSLNTYFYANSADEETIPAAATVSVVDYNLQLTGTVTGVDGRRFIIDNGKSQMQIDTSEMSYNPLDDEGSQQIEIGDRVSVTGDIDVGTWDKRLLMAEKIVTLAGHAKASRAE